MTLPDRIEAAEGGSRELDAEIAMAIGYFLIEQDWPEKPRWSALDGTLTPHRQGDPGFPSHYTTSIDAAMTLVPEGWGLDMRMTTDGKGIVALWPNGFCQGNAQGRASTPALALCAAALRAREA